MARYFESIKCPPFNEHKTPVNYRHTKIMSSCEIHFWYILGLCLCCRTLVVVISQYRDTGTGTFSVYLLCYAQMFTKHQLCFVFLPIMLDIMLCIYHHQETVIACTCVCTMQTTTSGPTLTLLCWHYDSQTNLPILPKECRKVWACL